MLRPGEPAVDGPEYERRFASMQNILLGVQNFQWLLEHKDEHPAFMEILGKVYFPGIVVVDEVGLRRVPYCGQGVPRWRFYCDWLGFLFL